MNSFLDKYLTKILNVINLILIVVISYQYFGGSEISDLIYFLFIILNTLKLILGISFKLPKHSQKRKKDYWNYVISPILLFLILTYFYVAS
tara:strand:- start:709 stop:981 length:273 start_codon:yes stop_codon:yes gene_type:complete